MHVQAYHGQGIFFRGVYAKLQEKIIYKASLRKKQNIPMRKRGYKRHKNMKHETLRLFGINAAGIRCEIKSFDDVLSRLKPHIWMAQETKLKVNEKIDCDSLNDFQLFYLSRQHSQGGGLALGVHKMFESTFINGGDDDTEVMSVLVVVGNIPIRIIIGYGVQENTLKEKKEKYWDLIEK